MRQSLLLSTLLTTTFLTFTQASPHEETGRSIHKRRLSKRAGSWTYDACYIDPKEKHVLPGFRYESDTLTVENCQSTCQQKGFRYAGVEYGRECWCADSITPGSTRADENDCNMNCAGGSGKCGAGYRINVYRLFNNDVPSPPPSATGKRSVGYFLNSGIYDHKYTPSLIPVNELTHVLYAFGKIDDNGNIGVADPHADEQVHHDGDNTWNNNWLYGGLGAFYKMKKQHRHLKVMVSIGGWKYSQQFHTVVLDANKRVQFARSAVQFLENYGLDGLEVDYEYPTTDEEARGYALLLAEVRKALDAHAASKGTNHRFLLTVAAPGGPYQYKVLHVAEMNKSLDFWNLMGYDMAGPWERNAGHQAAVYGGWVTVSVALQHYLDRGVPRDKIVLGIPLFGRAYENTDGPGKPFNGVGPGSWESGVYDYRALPLPGAKILYDDKNIASWSYDSSKREMVSFDDPVIAKRKAEWIVNQSLGGSMFWELSGDKGPARQNFPGGPGKDQQPGASLVKTVASAMGGLDRSDNWLAYPGSKWENVRRNA